MLTKFNQTYRRYLRFIHRVDQYALPITIANALGQIVVPYLTFILLGWLLNTVLGGTSINAIIWPLAGFLALIFCLQALAAAATNYFERLSMRLDNQITTMVADKQARVSLHLFNDPQFRKAYSAVDQGRMYFGGFDRFLEGNVTPVVNLILALLVTGTVIGHLFFTHSTTTTTLAAFANSWLYPLVLVAIIIIPIVVSIITSRIGWRIMQQFFTSNVQLNRELNYYFNHVFSEDKMGKTLRVYDIDNLMGNHLTEVNTRSYKNNAHTYVKSTRISALGGATIVLATGAIYIMLAIKSGTGAIPVGTVVMYAGFFTQLISAVSNLLNILGWAPSLNQALTATIDFLEMPDPGANGSLPIEKRRDNKYQLEFHDVSFKYPGAKEFALQHVNLKLAIGQRLALVGQNGSGKTTLIRLLTRLDQPTSGTITLNGIDIQKYDLHEYQQIFAAVFQDFKMFALPVVDNVAASAHPERARVESALEIAGVAERVHRMNHGIDTPLTRELDETGEDVSGGEAQKIAIARAWYKDAPFIILDEPTAALDPISEYDIYQHLDDLIANKTAIYISHRMSSTRFAARIVVLDHGQIVQDGTHASLMAEAGVYRDLFNAQAQYYTKERIAKERKNADLVYE
jgi:ABC-type multidrug transport system fused ATPase/permease subunit